MLPPQPQLRLLEIAACARRDRTEHDCLGPSIVLGLRGIDRAFETTLLITEEMLSLAVMHSVDWATGRPFPVKKIAC